MALAQDSATPEGPKQPPVPQQQQQQPFSVGGIHEGWSLASFKFIQGWEQPVENAQHVQNTINPRQDTNKQAPKQRQSSPDGWSLPSLFDNWPWGDAFSGKQHSNTTQVSNNKPQQNNPVTPPPPPPKSKAAEAVNPFSQPRPATVTPATIQAVSAPQQGPRPQSAPEYRRGQGGKSVSFRPQEELVIERASALQQAAKQALRDSDVVFKAIAASLEQDRAVASQSVVARKLPSQRPIHAQGMPLFYSWLPPNTLLKEDGTLKLPPESPPDVVADLPPENLANVRQRTALEFGLDTTFVRDWREMQGPALVAHDGSWWSPWGRPAPLDPTPPPARLGNKVYSGEQWEKIFQVTAEAKKQQQQLLLQQSLPLHEANLNLHAQARATGSHQPQPQAVASSSAPGLPVPVSTHNGVPIPPTATQPKQYI